MKTSSLKKTIALGAAVAALASIPNLRAGTPVSVFIEGGSASQSVLLDRGTNLFAGGSYTTTANGANTVRRFVGTSGDPTLAGLDITLDINVANGAIAGLQALVGTPGPADTNIVGTVTRPTFVDSATSPEAVTIDSVANHLVGRSTYVVPLVYIKNSNFPDLAAITNLTQRQAYALETSTNKTTFYGGTNPNAVVYFVGRNSQAAVRTEFDYVIYNAGNIKTFTNNSAGQAVQDKSGDPGLASGGAVANTVLALTNSIGTVAVQNLKSTLVPIAYEGVPYSVTNVINGSYPLWGYEKYYSIATGNSGAPDANQLKVYNAFYSSVTNATFQTITNPVFTNNFVPDAALRVSRDFDGGQITPLPNY